MRGLASVITIFVLVMAISQAFDIMPGVFSIQRVNKFQPE